MSEVSLVRCDTYETGVLKAAVRKAVDLMVLEAGGKPLIGDSPALEPFRRVAKKCGIAEVAEDLGVEWAALTRPTPVFLPEGAAFRQLEITAQALQADADSVARSVRRMPSVWKTGRSHLTITGVFDAIAARKSVLKMRYFSEKASW